MASIGTPPTVGSEVFNGYYRNANSETNGNFTSTVRSLGFMDQSLAVRIYGESGISSAVPEPSSLALCGIAGLIGLAVARSRRERGD